MLPLMKIYNMYKKNLLIFVKTNNLKRALMTSVDLLKAGDFDVIRMLVDNALKAGKIKI